MTIVLYDYTSPNGTVTSVSSLATAQQLVAQNGGTYKIRYDSTLSEYENYCRPNHRNNGDMK